MKLLHIFAILFTLHILAGCCKEDNSKCLPRHNVALLFSLPDSTGNETFARHISAVDVMVYDASGIYVQTIHVDKNALDRFQGVQLILPAGIYYLICWGNAFDNTRYNSIETPSISTVTYAAINGGNTAGQSDSLYYSGTIATRATGGLPEACVVTVPEKGEWQGTAIFRPACHQLEVYVKGYNENGNTLPHVKLNGLPAGLCLSDMAPLPDRTTVGSSSPTQTVTVLGQKYAAAKFRTFRLEPDSPVTIHITSPVTGETIFSVPLSKVMEQQSMKPYTIVICVVIEFKSTGVTVAIPNWNSDDIGFGFGWDY